MTAGSTKLIVLEGPDGVGKSTLARSVREAFALQGIDSLVVPLPGIAPGTFGRLVYDLHHEPGRFDLRHVHPASIQLLHTAAHIDTIEKTILPALQSSRWVILDRYWWSTLVYGKVSGVDKPTLDSIKAIAAHNWSRLPPRAVFLVERATRPQDQLTLEYRLLSEEAGRTEAVRVLQNDGAIEGAVAQVLDVALSGTTRVRPGRKLTAQVGELVFPVVVSKASPVKTTPVFDTYWRFATERQSILYKRLAGLPRPWTDDPVLRRHRFTNAYRASDRVSQYLIQHVIYDRAWSPRDLVFRILLFKIFNKIETWELLTQAFEHIDVASFSPARYSKVLARTRRDGTAIYSAAYIMASGKSGFGHASKHDNHLALLKRMIDDDIHLRVMDCGSLGKLFELLVTYPSLGPFLAFQYAIDINYSPIVAFDEMSFVVAGPGALDGIAKCFSDRGGLNDAELIRWTTERQDEECGRLGVTFRRLGNRPLQLIDCQNLFCETDKYARVVHPEFAGRSGRTRIKQVFTANQEPLTLRFPPKWKLDHFFPSGGIVEGNSNAPLFKQHRRRGLAAGG